MDGTVVAVVDASPDDRIDSTTLSVTAPAEPASSHVYGVTAEFVERNQSLWMELGYRDLPGRIRAGVHGDSMAALQLCVDEWAAAQVTDSASLALAAGRSQRFRKERGVQTLLGTIDTDVDIHEDYIHSAYNLQREKLKIPETREIARIVIFTATGTFGEDEFAKAQAIHERVLAGEDFGALADDVSDDKRFPGGNLGVIRMDGKTGIPGVLLDPDFVRVVFELQPGEISQPVRLDEGWHLLKCLAATAERYPGYEEAKPGLLAYLKVELYWMEIEKYLRLAQMTPGLQPEPASAWMIPALHEHLARQPIEISKRRYNATETLLGLWRAYQPREELEDQVRISWEKEQIRKALLAEMFLESFDLPSSVDIGNGTRGVEKRAGKFFIVDTGLDPAEPAVPQPSPGTEVLTIQDYVEGIEYARKLAIEKGYRLVDYAKHFRWELVTIETLDSEQRAQANRLLDGIDIGKASQAIAVGRYVIVAFRTPDVRVEQPTDSAVREFAYRKALLNYIYETHVAQPER